MLFRSGDINLNGVVDGADFAEFVEDWLKEEIDGRNL